MKNIKTFLLIALTAAIVSCEGPIGPPGLDGIDGQSFLGTVFEKSGDFTAQNDYTLFFEFPGNFEMYDTDIALVYILWDQVDGLDVWRLLPQTIALPEGIIQYNFDYTMYDVQIFMEGTIPPENWYSSETDNQVFRIVVLPADFIAKKSTDINDLGSIMKAPELKLNRINSPIIGK